MANETQREECFKLKWWRETVTSGNTASSVNTGRKRLRKFAGQASYRAICPGAHGSQRSSQKKKNKNKQKAPSPLHSFTLPFISSSQIVNLRVNIMLGHRRNEELRLSN